MKISLFVDHNLDLAKNYITGCGKLIDDLIGDGFEGNMSSHPSELWVGFIKGGETIGFVRFIPMNSVSAEVHPIFAHRHRGYALLCIRKAIKWIVEGGQIKKVVARFPSSPKVRACCKAIGLIPEGILSNAYLKNGVLSDMELWGNRVI